MLTEINNLEEMCDLMCDNKPPKKRITKEEAIETLTAIRDEATEDEHSVCYVTSEDADALNMAIEALKVSEIQTGSDTISRQDAINAICKDWCGSLHKDCKTPFNQETDEYYHCDGCGDVETLLSLPSATTEIIMCKDCKYYKAKQGGLPWNHCRRYCNRSVSLATNPNDFCSYGERMKE